ncbi:Lipase, GDSL [Corchorus olitorius]|uniref:Lipase, GDSL n=1 Tax=Corchorus olitorius TaxID=93759 RepID=A0A1R3K7H1_9ROSI|nr:Lipase, GDSL [Corchorus olitorius]
MSILISSNILLFTLVHLLLQIQSKPLAPALYVFGDSLFDSGNNNLLPTVARADYPPYGINFVKHSTGRFTNGRTLPDFIAEFLELPYPPPYLSIPDEDSMKLTGLNYASASCGILPETGRQYGKCLSLGEQIEMFQRTIEKKLLFSHFKKSEELSNYQDYDPQSFAQLLINALSNHLQRLYRLGARKIVTLEIPPLGCIPHFTRKYELTEKCHEETNQIVSYFNNKLPATLKELASTLPGSVFVLARIYSLGYNAVNNPSKYGFADVSNPCCSTWENGTSACIPFQAPCSNPNEHFFWDGYHNTETGNAIAAALCFNDPGFCSPINIKELTRI